MSLIDGLLAGAFAVNLFTLVLFEVRRVRDRRERQQRIERAREEIAAMHRHPASNLRVLNRL